MRDLAWLAERASLTLLLNGAETIILWNSTHFRHPTDEQLGHVDTFFSNYYNLQSVYFELKKKNKTKQNKTKQTVVSHLNLESSPLSTTKHLIKYSEFNSKRFL